LRRPFYLFESRKDVLLVQEKYTVCVYVEHAHCLNFFFEIFCSRFGSRQPGQYPSGIQFTRKDDALYLCYAPSCFPFFMRVAVVHLCAVQLTQLHAVGQKGICRFVPWCFSLSLLATKATLLLALSRMLLISGNKASKLNTCMQSM
jgi:hypothetical protein